jgi:hypothetical protein
MLVKELQDAGYESPYLDRLRGRLDVFQAQEQLEKEIVREMAVALGRTEDKLNVALLRLELARKDLDTAADADTGERVARTARFNTLRGEALRARHELLIHREAVGMRRNAILESVYPIPGPLPAPAEPRRK